jgi:predicted lipoprotein
MAKMAGKPTLSSCFTLSALTLGAFAVQSGCADNTQSGDVMPEAVRDAMVGMLDDLWPSVLQHTLDDAHSAAVILNTATTQWAASNGSASAQLNAQTAWLEAMEAWQLMELIQLGPSGSSLNVVNGEDIRDEIYSWPTTNPCRVDQATARNEYEADDFFETALVNSTGFDALETLLFSPTNENDCPAQVNINAQGIWAELGEDGVTAARAHYAAVLSSQIIVEIERIDQRWTDSFELQLRHAGQADSAFKSQLSAINAIFNALFYLETQTKNRKIGWPSGVTDCGQSDCTTEVESPVAGGSHRWVAANLVGFRRLFTGADGMGLEDLLIAVDAEDLAKKMLMALDEADATVAALDAPLDTVDANKLAAAYDALQAVTTLLKSDIATILTLAVPTEAAGDND